MYLLVSLLQLNALVAGNGSYLLRPCGHDLHGPTEEEASEEDREVQKIVAQGRRRGEGEEEEGEVEDMDW